MGVRELVRRWFGGGVPTWYDPAYRLPIPSLEARAGIEPRRADFVAWFLADQHLLGPKELRHPPRAAWSDIARVHTAAHIESLDSAEVLAHAFAVDPWEIPAEEVLITMRLAVGATLAAAREALHTGGPTLNLLGGFHHAGPARAAGLCLINDIAVALAAVRSDGFTGQAVIIDLDAHPADGTAACLLNAPKTWIGSLSGSDWGPIPGADETALPAHTGDGPYLEALDALLRRMPTPELAFVIAGGDVLAGDNMGMLGLSLAGARRRDRMVAERLREVPSVWLPGGGYSTPAWRVLAGTALELAGSAEEIPEAYEPMRVHFSRIFGRLDPSALGGAAEESFISAADVEEALGLRTVRDPRLMGFYTPSGLEYAFYQYGVLDHLRRLGYRDFRVALGQAESGERFRLFGRADDTEHLLIEVVVDRIRLYDEEYLFINWLNLRNPKARFSPTRPQLPGQEVPGLGLAPEISMMLALMAERLRLRGLVFRPAWYHVAIASRKTFRFCDPERHGRFEAMQRDLHDVPLLELTRAVAEGRVRVNGEPYSWEAEPMVFTQSGDKPDPSWQDAMEAAREASHFSVVG